MNRVWKPGNKYCNEAKHEESVYDTMHLRHYNMYTDQDYPIKPEHKNPHAKEHKMSNYTDRIAAIIRALPESKQKLVLDYAESVLFSMSPDYSSVLRIESETASNNPSSDVSLIQVNKALEPDILSFKEWRRWYADYSNSEYKRKSFEEKMNLHRRYNEYVEYEREEARRGKRSETEIPAVDSDQSIELLDPKDYECYDVISYRELYRGTRISETTIQNLSSDKKMELKKRY